MKKTAIAALAILLALCLAVPSLAATEAAGGPSPRLSVYIVDYASAAKFGVNALPAVGRSYGANEKIAAVVELYVPANMDLSASATYYGGLTINGQDLSFNVPENAFSVLSATVKAVKPAGLSKDVFTYDPASGTLSRRDHASNLASGANGFTYKWLVFARVTGANAALTATLTGGDGSDDLAAKGYLHMTLGGITYMVLKRAGTDYGYEIYVESGLYKNSAIRIYTDSTGKTTGMAVRAVINGVPGGEAALGVWVNGALGYYDPANSILITSPDQATSSVNRFSSIMAVYSAIAKNVLGLDYYKIGNYVSDSTFLNMVNPPTLTAAADIGHTRTVPKAKGK